MNLQGLEQSMLKLWERCEIVKIAVKSDAQDTNTELMVEELKVYLLTLSYGKKLFPLLVLSFDLLVTKALIFI